MVEKRLDRAIWEGLEDLSKRFESLITAIENTVGVSDARNAAIEKLNAAYQDIVQASRNDQEQRDNQKGKK
ncbi:MAG: hypothetical protein NTX25_23215 [Proteobacteria bacterium]|nr:hypothetical protein [Pseudomonadota bacterium]